MDIFVFRSFCTLHGTMRLWLLVNVLTCCYAVNVSSLFGLDPTAPKSLCMDLVFMVDTSCSVANADFPKMQKFMTDMVDGIEKLSPLATRIGIGMFDDGARVIIPIYEYTDKEELKVAITNADYRAIACRTNTDVALQMVREDSRLLGGDKVDNRARIMVMITDGEPKYRRKVKTEQQATDDTIAQAKLNKEDGITGIVVMVRNSDGEIIPEDKHYIFNAIASAPLDKHKFAIDDLAEGVKDVFKTLAHNKCPYTCSKKIDLVFAMDRSESISSGNITMTKLFLRKLARSFTLGPRYTCIAMVSYNKGVEYHFKLEESLNHNIDELIDEVPETNHPYTETNKALKLVRQVILGGSKRTDATKVCLVTTDGITYINGNKQESPPDRRNPTIGEGRLYYRKRYNLVILGEPNENGKNGYQEWIQTATDPDFDPNNPDSSPDDNIFNLQDGSSFDDLNSIAPYIAEQICSLAPE